MDQVLTSKTLSIYEKHYMWAQEQLLKLSFLDYILESAKFLNLYVFCIFLNVIRLCKIVIIS